MTDLAALSEGLPREPAWSNWRLVDQAQVDRHAETTGDAQWIHNDPERARREGPFGGPVVQGFLLLALLTELGEQALTPPPGIAWMVNYGFDRVRFLRPVPVGARVRAGVRPTAVRPRGEGQAVLHVDVVMEAQGQPEPVLVAEWLFLVALPSAEADG